MTRAPTDCGRCPRLVESRRAVVNGSGPLPARVLVVAQNPGREEEIHGEPLFAGAWSGSRIRTKLLPLAGLSESEVRFENVVRCRPPRGKLGDLPPTKGEVENCAPFLAAVLEQCKPEVIVTLGAFALRWFLPDAKLELIHGRPQDVPLDLDHGRQVVVVPMYHPAAAHPKRNPRIAQILVNDWERLGEFLRSVPQGRLGRYQAVGVEEMRHLLAGPGAVLAFDFETTDPRWRGTFQAVRAKPIGVSVAMKEGEAFYCATNDVSFLRPVLENPAIPKVAHNACFEYIVARNCGIQPRNLHDTKLLAYVLRRPSTHLKDLTWEEFSIKQTRFEAVDWANMDEVVQYGAADSDMTLRLWNKLAQEVQAKGLWALYELERAALPVLAETTIRGVAIDTEPILKLQEVLLTERGAQVAQLEAFFQVPSLPVEDRAEFNLNSDEQLRRLLYGPKRLRALRKRELRGRLQHCCLPDERRCCVGTACAGGVRTGAQTVLRWFPPGLGWKVKRRTESGKPATDMDTLRLYGNEPVVGDLVRLRSMNQLLENDLARLPLLTQEDGRIHPTFHQAGQWEEKPGEAKEGPITGRMSSSGPNLQNITHHGDVERPYVADWAREIRRAFVPSPGMVLFKADIGQEEPRIGALLAKDQDLLSALDVGDVYCPVASMEFGHTVTKADVEERQIGKRGWMAWLNGAGPDGIRQSAFWLSTREAQAVVRFLQEAHPKVEAYRASLVAQLHARGYTETLFGRQIHRPEVWAGPGATRNHAERSVMPDAIQGTAADVMKLWLPRIQARLPADAHLLLTVHDEVVGEAPAVLLPLIKRALDDALTGILPIRLPCEFMCGPNWADMGSYDTLAG